MSKRVSQRQPLGRLSSAALLFLAPAAQRRQIAEVLAGKNLGRCHIRRDKDLSAFQCYGTGSSETASVNKPFCRVEGVLKPSADSDVKFEVWLPPESAWNGKYQGIGNGGTCIMLRFCARRCGESLSYRARAAPADCPAGYAREGRRYRHRGR